MHEPDVFPSSGSDVHHGTERLQRENVAPAVSSPARSPTLAGDILAGADAIAEFVFGDRKHRRKVYNLVETGRLPVFRLGVNICARKSVLLDWIAGQERKQTLRTKDGDSRP